jgi:gluconolactonase
MIPVISRSSILNPNGIRVNKEMTKLYVGETTSTTSVGAAASNFSSPSLWVFDLDDEANIANQQYIGLSRVGGIDGMHLDDEGRVWTGEGEGIVVRNEGGAVLGLINSEPLLSPTRDPAIALANFAIAGDKIVILAVTKLYVLELASSITSGGSFAGGSS